MALFDALTAGAGPLAALVLRASLQGALAVALVWAVCRLAPRLPAAVRCGLWWLACGRLLLALAWPSAVALPVLPASRDELASVMAVPAPAVTAAAGEKHALPARAATPAPSHRLAAAVPSPAPGRTLRAAVSGVPWLLLAVAAWVTGVLAQVALAGAHLVRLRGVLRRAVRVTEPEVVDLAAALARRLGLRRPVEVLASPEIATPQVAGLLRPRVLLPAGALPGLTPDELAMTLCHELLHVRRGDLWLGWVPALAQRLFFFHPLARLAAREHALAREAACDAAVLRVMRPAPDAYGRLLLRLGVAPRPPRWTAAGAAPTFRILKRRLEMLEQSTDGARLRRAWWLALVPLALVVLVPFTMVAQEQDDPPAVPAVPAVATVPAVAPVLAVAAPAPVPAVAAVAGAPGVPVLAAAPNVPVLANVAVRAVTAVASAVHAVARVEPVKSGFAYAFGGDDEPFVLQYGNGTTTMSGSTYEIHRARKHLGERGAGIWFVHDGEEYVIRDEATVAAVQELFAPQAELGKRQAELGERQAALGERQAELGHRQGELGRLQGELAGRQGQLAAQQAELAVRQIGASEAERERLDEQMERLNDQMRALGREMREHGEPMAELGRRQAELGREQGELGRQQGELGRQQGELARVAQRELRELLDKAVASGLAQRVD